MKLFPVAKYVIALEFQLIKAIESFQTLIKKITFLLFLKINKIIVINIKKAPTEIRHL